jgi:hypothetical protein
MPSEWPACLNELRPEAHFLVGLRRFGAIYFFLVADFGCMIELVPAAGFSLGCFGFLCSRLLLWPLAIDLLHC